MNSYLSATGDPGEVRCGFFQEFVLHAELAKFALGLGQLDPLMRGERGLVAGVVAAVLVYPVAECSHVHAELSCDLGDRAGSVDHKSHGLVPELGTERAVLPYHSLHHLPGQILLDRGPRTTGHLRAASAHDLDRQLGVREQDPAGHRVADAASLRVRDSRRPCPASWVRSTAGMSRQGSPTSCWCSLGRLPLTMNT